MSKRMSQPAAPASTIVTTIVLQFVALVSTGRESIGSSHPLGDFEHEPAKSGKTDSPEKHHRDHRLPLFFLQDDYDVTVR
jgi:hypothetical protein